MSGPEYGEKQYWNSRYEHNLATYEWYESYEPLRRILLEFALPKQPVLQVHMYHDGISRIHNQDISSAVIEHMKTLHPELEGLTYITGDCRHMPELDDEAYGTVLDKGTIDSVLCDEGGAEQAAAALRECFRVLAAGGRYLMITYGSPVHRLQHIVQIHLNWDVRMFNLDRVSDDGDTADVQQPVPPPPPPGNPPEVAAKAAEDPLQEPHLKRQPTVQHSRKLPPEISPDQAVSIGAREGHYVYVCTKRPSGAESSSPHMRALLEQAGMAPFDAEYNQTGLAKTDGHGHKHSAPQGSGRLPGKKQKADHA